MPMKLSVSRRTWLKTFAGLTAAAPFQGLLRDAFAQSMPTYPRFVVVYNPNGCSPDFWRPRAPGGGPADKTGWTLDFDPDSSMGPLEKHKDSLIIMEGLDLTCNFDQADEYLGHNGGAVAPLTGLHARATQDADSMRTTGPSIDHAVAKQLKVAPFLFHPTGYAGSNLHITFDDAGERVPNEYELRTSFDKWFGSFMAPSSMPDPKALARKAADQSVLDFLNADASRLRPRLAGPEKLKMDAFIDGLNLLQQKINGGGAPLAACQKPMRPANISGTVETIQTMLQLTAQLLACNLTRVANVNIDPVNSGKMAWLPAPLNTLACHNDIAHGFRPGDPVSGRNLSILHRWYATMMAYFIEQLKGIAEGNGTVYDNTIILWSNELGDPSQHMNNNLPFVIAGGGGTFKRGQYLKFGISASYKDSKDSHGPLLTSIANQFGMNTMCFGDPRYPGELAGLT
jgi:hypothetical protein